jgi:predicted transcriptional regulator
MTYLDQLTALLKKFTQSEISDLLGVTERTIQFWIAEESPKIPFQKAQRKIHELYTNLIKEGKTVEEVNTVQEPIISFQTKRLAQKTTRPQPHMAPLIPVKAQAGYVRAIGSINLH